MGKYTLALLGLFLITGQALAGEEIIWEYRNDTLPPPGFLDPADYPNDALYKVFKAKREAREILRDHPSGSIFKDCADCPEMVVVPPGFFRMGDLNGGGGDNEKPVHSVTIPRPFAVGKYEVTQAQWKAVIGSNPSKFKGDDRPVENVSWNDAKEFIAKLNAKTGKKYRLLTESEWEYAARAGTTTKYNCGNSDSCFILNGTAWYTGNSGSKTHPVGQKSANAFGLYDMHGNVWEWVEDCYKDSYRNAPSDGSARTGNNSCDRVNRGGSWVDLPGFLRSANRIRNYPDDRFINLGFRLARTL